MGGGVPEPYCSTWLSSGVGSPTELSLSFGSVFFGMVEPVIFSGMKRIPLDVIFGTFQDIDVYFLTM